MKGKTLSRQNVVSVPFVSSYALVYSPSAAVQENNKFVGKTDNKY
jgi:hypothetical protein